MPTFDDDVLQYALPDLKAARRKTAKQVQMTVSTVAVTSSHSIRYQVQPLDPEHPLRVNVDPLAVTVSVQICELI